MLTPLLLRRGVQPPPQFIPEPEVGASHTGVRLGRGGGLQLAADDGPVVSPIGVGRPELVRLIVLVYELLVVEQHQAQPFEHAAAHSTVVGHIAYGSGEQLQRGQALLPVDDLTDLDTAVRSADLFQDDCAHEVR